LLALYWLGRLSYSKRFHLFPKQTKITSKLFHI
jgi:hypothetical protein